MALLEALPETVENSLRELNQQSENTESSPPEVSKAEENGNEETNGYKRLAFATDLSENGAFGTEWLVVDAEKVYVFSPNGGERAHLRHAVPLAHIKQAKAEMGVG